MNRTEPPGWKLTKKSCQHQELNGDGPYGPPRCGERKVEVHGLMLCPACDASAIATARRQR